MPMIDVTATEGTFVDAHGLAQAVAEAVMRIEQVPNIPMFRQNTAGFVHEVPARMLADVDGSDAHVRVQVLTNAGALDRDKQLAVVSELAVVTELTRLVAEAAGDPGIADRTWVLLTEAPDGGWGLHGQAHTNSELVAAARAEIAALSAAPDA
jgi:phenylpyruvate tautomerase PptA (4-oxalocrotonate tautomerase family)